MLEDAEVEVGSHTCRVISFQKFSFPAKSLVSDIKLVIFITKLFPFFMHISGLYILYQYFFRLNNFVEYTAYFLVGTEISENS